MEGYWLWLLSTLPQIGQSTHIIKVSMLKKCVKKDMKSVDAINKSAASYPPYFSVLTSGNAQEHSVPCLLLRITVYQVDGLPSHAWIFSMTFLVSDFYYNEDFTFNKSTFWHLTALWCQILAVLHYHFLPSKQVPPWKILSITNMGCQYMRCKLSHCWTTSSVCWLKVNILRLMILNAGLFLISTKFSAHTN